jgi:16S rRNA (cytosine967-C5)-methyltransferase
VKRSGRATAKKVADTSRSIALKILQKVFQGRSLASVKAEANALEKRQRALTMELVNGVLRWRWKLEYLLARLMKKPLRSKEQEVKLLLLLALYELIELSTPEYAVVNETVQLSRSLGKAWASGLVNGVLRSFVRDKQSYLSRSDSEDVAKYSHPEWFIKLLRKDWPEHWQQILQANNQRPPLWLRVNRVQKETQQYKKLLDEQGLESSVHHFAPQAIKLERGVNVFSLPGFDEGMVSVQDAGAQLAAGMLDIHAGQKVLDLCAAPGGKTCHLLELEPGIKKLVAVELEQQRMQRVRENLDRLNLDAELIVADASDVATWWDGDPFDRILVDAPCSASGVIRRHPDIKSLRREDDLPSLVQTQQKILQQAWAVLSSGGLLLYVTCSVLRQENEAQIKKLLSEHDDAEELILDASWGVSCDHGRQLLPGEDDSDGFYFACLRKTGI